VDVKTLFGDIREGAEAENPGVVDQDVAGKPSAVAIPLPMPLDATATLPVSLLIVLSFLRADVPQVMRGVNSCLASGPSC